MPNILLGTTNQSLNGKLNQFYNAPGTNVSQLTTENVATYPHLGTTNLSLGYYKGASNYLFWNQFYNTNGTKGTVSITSPWTESTAVTNGSIGLGKQAFSAVYTYITVTVSVNYGYSFKGWYTLPTGGTLISASATYNFAYNDAYINTTFYAQYN